MKPTHRIYSEEKNWRTFSSFTLFISVLFFIATTIFFSQKTFASNPTPFFSFHDPTLLSGSAGQVGAVYKFADVSTGIDAWVEILSLDGGAQLSDPDHFTAGYFKAWQPFVVAQANDTSSINWKISFKKAGTSTDTTLVKIVVTALDVDGDGVTLEEFVEALSPTTYSVYSSCNLSISFNNGKLKAISPVTNQPNIDTLVQLAMFQMKFLNRSYIIYRTGSISTKSSTDIRQSSLYFKGFFTDEVVLPVKLVSFDVSTDNEKNFLHWKTKSEINCNDFTIERSENGIDFTSLGSVKGAGTTDFEHNYSFVDEQPALGNNYYRLRENDFDGEFSYSEIEVVNCAVENSALKNFMLIASPNPFTSELRVNCFYERDCKMKCEILNASGNVIASEKRDAEKGNNQFYFYEFADLPRGTYLVIVTANNYSKSLKVVKR